MSNYSYLAILEIIFSKSSVLPRKQLCFCALPYLPIVSKFINKVKNNDIDRLAAKLGVDNFNYKAIRTIFPPA